VNHKIYQIIKSLCEKSAKAFFLQQQIIITSSESYKLPDDGNDNDDGHDDVPALL